MDVVEWQLYSMDELIDISDKIGFGKVSFYSDFTDQEAKDEDSRIQVIFQK